jgi:hypothetical protein
VSGATTHLKLAYLIRYTALLYAESRQQKKKLLKDTPQAEELNKKEKIVFAKIVGQGFLSTTMTCFVKIVK